VSEHDESATEENETSLKSHGDKEEESKIRGCEEEGDQDNTDAKEKDVESETPKLSTSRRSSKKLTADEMGGSKTQTASPADADWKEDRSFWENEEGKVSITYLRLQLALEISCPSLFLLDTIKLKLNSVALVRKRSIPTKRPPLSAKLVPTSQLSRPEPLLFLPSCSSVVLTRLSEPRSRPTTTQKIW
jgi:hypothetical protein